MESGNLSPGYWKKRMLKRAIESSCSTGGLVTVHKPNDFLLNRTERMGDEPISDTIINSTCESERVSVSLCPVAGKCTSHVKANICCGPITEHPDVVLASHSSVTNSTERICSETHWTLRNSRKYGSENPYLRRGLGSENTKLPANGNEQLDLSVPISYNDLNYDKELGLSSRVPYDYVKQSSDSEREGEKLPNITKVNELSGFVHFLQTTQRGTSELSTVSVTNVLPNAFSSHMDVLSAGDYRLKGLPSSSSGKTKDFSSEPFHGCMELNTDSNCKSAELSVSTSREELNVSAHTLRTQTKTDGAIGHEEPGFPSIPRTVLLSDKAIDSAEDHRVEGLPRNWRDNTKDLSSRAVFDYVVLSSVSEAENEEQALEQSNSREPNMAAMTVPSNRQKQNLDSQQKSDVQESELIQDGTGFPSFFDGLVTVGKYTPLGSKFAAKSFLSLLQTPSLVTPLLLKEPDKFPPREKGVKTENKDLFSSAVGEFLISLGLSAVSEMYHRDSIREKTLQIRKEGKSQSLEGELEIHKNGYAEAKKANQPFSHPLKSCDMCKFVTESSIVLEDHRLIVHVTAEGKYRCSFCTHVSFDSQDMLTHMKFVHGKIGRTEPPSLLYTCSNCIYQSTSQRGLVSHMSYCRRSFNASTNQAPPWNYEFPGITSKLASVVAVKTLQSPAFNKELRGRKDFPGTIPQTRGDSNNRNTFLNPGVIQSNSLESSKTYLLLRPVNVNSGTTATRITEKTAAYYPGSLHQTLGDLNNRNGSLNRCTDLPRTMLRRVSGRGNLQKLLPTPGTQNRSTLLLLQLSPNDNQADTFTSPQLSTSKSAISKLNTNTLSTDIHGNTVGQQEATFSTPKLQHSANRPLPKLQGPYPVRSDTEVQSKKLVVCEICDGYLKDLEQFCCHMDVAHKVKIHPKRLASRPQLNCGKCDWFFYTHQGLERHLLTWHGIVTSHLQELANRGQDGGYCVLCGGVYASKIVDHINQIHKLNTKPANLSYKCTICSATFNLFGSFEDHIQRVHGRAAKRPSESNDISPRKKSAKLSNSDRTVIVKQKDSEK